MDSILHISDASNLVCNIEKYQFGHSELSLLVANETESLYRLTFISLEYIQAPVQWQSALFRLPTDIEQEELNDLLANYSSTGSKPAWINDVKLYIVDAIRPKTAVKIACGLAVIQNLKG